MRWTERQRAMLEEIGVRLWLPPDSPSTLAPLSTGAPVDATGRAKARARDAASSAPTTMRAGVEIDTSAGVRADIGGDSNTDVGTLDWPALTVRAAACTACALCAGRTRSVFGAGHVQADWMIVADAPDADDDRTGLPLSGRAGRLLDNMLDAIRLTRDAADASRQVYVTQSVKCRPPDRNPEPAEVACCEPFLLRQIELVRPRIILAMGRVAAQALVGSAEAPARLRGRIHRYAGVPVIVTFAPAYLLRHPQDKAAAWEDLCLALQVVNDPAAAPGSG